jgi:hypothetical protein
MHLLRTINATAVVWYSSLFLVTAGSAILHEPPALKTIAVVLFAPLASLLAASPLIVLFGCAARIALPPLGRQPVGRALSLAAALGASIGLTTSCYASAFGAHLGLVLPDSLLGPVGSLRWLMLTAIASLVATTSLVCVRLRGPNQKHSLSAA